MKALVTGGAGFIGSNIVKAALKKGWDVRVLDNFFLGKSANLDDVIGDIELLKGDVRDEKAVKAATRGVDYVFHEAAISSSQMFVPDPGLGISVNVQGFSNLLRCAQENGVKRVVHATTSTIYGSLPTPHREDYFINRCGNFYSMTKFAAEHLAKTFTAERGIETVGLRYFSVYGPGETHKGKYANLITQFLWGMKKGERPVIYGDGKQTRDFVFAEDVARANLLAATGKRASGEVINVGTGKPIPVNAATTLLNKYLGTELQPEYRPNPITGYVYKHQADTAKAAKLIGFRAKVPFAKGLKLLIKCYE